MSAQPQRFVPRTPVLSTRPAPLQPELRTTAPTRVLEPRRAPQQLSLFTR
jgi:hypothetical protein